MARGAGVLLMDESGSVGLDLSFAGWVFLMEPVEEAALESQVVARAHRMGAPRGRPIQVETLVMKVRQVQRFIFAIDVLDGYARR